jgi:hypothetical protein
MSWVERVRFLGLTADSAVARARAAPEVSSRWMFGRSLTRLPQSSQAP